jgi:membrane associated rhomboid family serine protease
MREPRSRYFTLIWVILNAAIPLLPLIIGERLEIAWQAHLGGFLAGLLLVPLFERVPKGESK